MSILNPSECSGCMACYNICPVDAIIIKSDLKGFYYPEINDDICLHCNKCTNTCPLLHVDNVDFHSPITSYIGKNSDEMRKKSSSGGIFSLLSDQTLKNNGVVYGAKFNSDLNVEHGKAKTIEERDEFCGSKYIQSNIGNAFRSVKEELEKDNNVFFSGSACQVAGLLRYLEIERCNTDKLVTQDFVCHGVGSPSFFHDYLAEFEKKYKAKVIKVNFRGKPKKGKLSNTIIDFDNGKHYIAISVKCDIFYYHFLNNYILRPSCYNCKFAKCERVSDFTLGDCYNPNKVGVEDDGKGLSFIQVNTEKGQAFLKDCINKAEFHEIGVNKYYHPNMHHASTENKDGEAFWNEYTKNGYASAIRKYGNKNIKNSIQKTIAVIVYYLGLEDIVKRLFK
ncbi:MAG: 4Fe-4S dicluster domain-containing protein [Butyrivibrio sp.]|nr:4Fe-4S dicluster domain-containing protein [Butyrivibrio sp.]